MMLEERRTRLGTQPTGREPTPLSSSIAPAWPPSLPLGPSLHYPPQLSFTALPSLTPLLHFPAQWAKKSAIMLEFLRIELLFIQLAVMLLPGLIWAQVVVTYAM